MRTSCRLCDSTNLVKAVSAEMPLVDGFTEAPNQHKVYPCDVYLCADCGHAQLLDFLPAEDMFCDYHFTTGDYPHLVDHFKSYAKWAIDRFDPYFVIEIGCNDGTLLSQFQCKTFGVDPSNVICKTDKMTAFFNSESAALIMREHGHADLIIANHVFAHADDLGGMLEAVKSLLTSRGSFVFEVAYVQDMLNDCLYDQIEHEHLSYHAIHPLIRFLNKRGMEMTSYSHNDCKGGSIRCVATALDTGHYPHYKEDCTDLSRFEDFSKRIQIKADALSHIDKAIGYGAAAPCTSVTYQLGLQDRLIGLVDDNPKKIGLYSPNTNLLVQPSSYLYESTEPIIILAPRYADKIMARHPKLKDRFVIP